MSCIWDWNDSIEDLSVGYFRDLLRIICWHVNKREITIGKIPRGANYGPWYDAYVNSSGECVDTEWWTYWIGGHCEPIYNPDALSTTWYRNLGDLGLSWLYGPNPSADDFEDMEIGATFDERDHWDFEKCFEGIPGTLKIADQRECNPPLARQIDAIRNGIKNLLLTTNSGSPSGGHRAGATHYSASFVYPCGGTSVGPPGSSPGNHCRWMRQQALGSFQSCAAKAGWCGDWGGESSLGTVYCDEDCWAKGTNKNNYGLEQSEMTRTYCYWLLPRLLNYVNYKANYINKTLPLGYDGIWWWETDRSWAEMTEDDGRTIKSEYTSSAVIQIQSYGRGFQLH